ncbi:hypothetical protein SNEBB_009513 [Seison nebaliae]|nr:hypothetical protein SNEBB_009513 [Seison nebaliae]
MDFIKKGMAEGMFKSLSDGICHLIFPLLCIFLNQGSKVEQIIEKASSKETVKLLKDGKSLFKLTNTGRIGPLAITLPRLGTLFPDILAMPQVSVNMSQFGMLAWYRAPITYAIGNMIGGRNGAALKRLHIEAKEKLDSFLKNKARTPKEELERFAELSIQTIALNERWARIIAVKCGALTARIVVTLVKGYGMIGKIRKEMEMSEETSVKTSVFTAMEDLTKENEEAILEVERVNAMKVNSMELNESLNGEVFAYLNTRNIVKYPNSYTIISTITIKEPVISTKYANQFY